LGENYDEIIGLEEPGTGVMEQDPKTGIIGQKPGTGVKCVLTDHVWLVDHSVAIATENKVIFIVRGGEIKHVCSPSNNNYALLRIYLSLDSNLSD